MSQRALAAEAQVPRDDIIRLESGFAGELRLDRLRRIFAAADGRGRFSVWWNGAAADRLLDERHAALVERTVAVFERRNWQPIVEASFSEFGDRGSIDVFAGHAQYRAVAVSEIKSDLGSTEEMNRMIDTKVRVAPKLALERFGWRPAVVGRILVLPDEGAMRRVIDRHARTMASQYPMRGREIRAWLRKPDRPIGGIWFLSEVGDPDLGA